MQDTNHLNLASLKSRTLAFLIDDLIVSFIIIFIFWDNIAPLFMSNASEEVLAIITKPLILLKLVYHTFFIWYYGATAGKMILKIKVVNDDLGRLSFFSSFLRAIARVLSEMFFYIGFAISLYGDKRKTFQDIAAKTLVVNA